MTLKELKAAPTKLSPQERARLDAMTDEEIERNALADSDNPPMTDDELTRAAFARTVRRAREKSGLSQAQFAERYQINLGRLRDWEQGRSQPDSVAVAYVTVIGYDPKTVERALEPT
jgi:putative transcriptional regulator